jgi:hypothetical protein
MIHHLSIDAHNPLRVASVLAEIWHGKVYQFLISGSYLMIPFDNGSPAFMVISFAYLNNWSEAEII